MTDSSTPNDLALDLPDATAQELVVEVEGPDLPHLPGTPGAAGEVFPHPVAAFTAAADLGMLGGASIAPWESRATATPDPRQPSASRQRWRVSLANVDPGAVRVLLNLLQARVPEAAALAVRTVYPTPAGMRRLDARALVLPGRYRDVAFTVDDENATGSRKHRRFALRFAQPLPDPDADVALAAATAWWHLLVMGGYAAAGDDPAYSATGIDEPYWHDEVTIACFFEVFDADERAFDPIINWAARVHRDGLRVDAAFIA